MSLVWGNFASGELESAIASGATTLTVKLGQGALFPAPSPPDYAKVVLEDSSGFREIVHMTARSGDVLTITRAQEGTTALAFDVDSKVETRVTAGFLTDFVDGGEY